MPPPPNLDPLPPGELVSPLPSPPTMCLFLQKIHCALSIMVQGLFYEWKQSFSQLHLPWETWACTGCLLSRVSSTCLCCHLPLIQELKGKAGGLVTSALGKCRLSTSTFIRFWPCASPDLASLGQQGGHYAQILWGYLDPLPLLPPQSLRLFVSHSSLAACALSFTFLGSPLFTCPDV